MDSEKVKEIKKALKFMMGLDLSNKLPYIDGNTIKQIAYEEIFNYINDLESENERLIDKCGEQSVLWRNHFNSIYETAIENYKNRIAELEKENAEQLNHFVERLKENADGICIKNDILYARKGNRNKGD